jgi:transposase InsO family protein
MGGKGCASDDAVKESFFATLKKDLVHRSSWPTRQELCTVVFDYIECFYDPARLHSALGYLSPVEYEQRHSAAPDRARQASHRGAPARRAAVTLSGRINPTDHPRPRAGP